jgi:4-amino-4-deoxy-L-arabinose transferase-like glycosyltransferase
MKISVEPRRLSLIVILALAVLPYCINLGSSSLWDSNEAFYAQTPREMIDAGDYVNPTFNYQPRFNKPPLVYWVVALFYRALGVSEAVERLPIALAALALIGSALCLGRTAFSPDAGLIAAIVLASTPRFLMFSRRIVIDVFLAMFMSLALLLFALSQRSPRWRRSCLVLMYVAIALGVLTKGPVSILLPGAAILLYLAIDRRLGVLRELMVGPGLVIVLLIVCPWYVAVYSETTTSHATRSRCGVQGGVHSSMSRYWRATFCPGPSSCRRRFGTRFDSNFKPRNGRQFVQATR